MKYLDTMEAVDSDIMDKVLNAMNHYDYHRYMAADVRSALAKDNLNPEDFAALLSPAAFPFLEEMAHKAQYETRKHFGNSVCMFTPLYIANYCENECVYCGFNCKNKIHRAKLTYEEIDHELSVIAATGLKEILILTGESRHMSDVEYIGEALKLARKYFSTIGIEIYPLNSDEYRYLHECGADFVSVYQETYNPVKYEQMHLSGPKRIYPYRLNAQERALMGGMRGVSFGALLGLDDFRKDAFASGMHAYFIQQKYPHAEISFSTPRLRPYVNNAENNPNDVHEPQLLQVMLAYRPLYAICRNHYFHPGTGRIPGQCDRQAATKISAGVSVGVGGHEEEAKGDEQFEISDPRSVTEVHNAILNHGLQPVYTDYLWV